MKTRKLTVADFLDKHRGMYPNEMKRAEKLCRVPLTHELAFESLSELFNYSETAEGFEFWKQLNDKIT